MMKWITPKFIIAWRAEIKEIGFKPFLKRHGWKVLAGFILFYLVRDTILYILLPYLMINNVISCQ